MYALLFITMYNYNYDQIYSQLYLYVKLEVYKGVASLLSLTRQQMLSLFYLSHKTMRTLDLVKHLHALYICLNKASKGGNHHKLEEQVKGKYCHGRTCALLPKAQKVSLTHYMLELPSMKDDTMSVAILWNCQTSFCLSSHAYWLKTGSHGCIIRKIHCICLSLKCIKIHIAFTYHVFQLNRNVVLQKPTVLVSCVNKNKTALHPTLHPNDSPTLPFSCVKPVQTGKKQNYSGG